jgi:cell division protein FtsW
MRLNRSDRSLVSDWWFTIDRLMLSAVLLLMLGGLVLSLAASPSVAERLGYDTFHFFQRHTIAFVPALAILFFSSLLEPRMIRRASLVLFAVSILLMVATLVVGPETKGATRWLKFGGLSLQSSEFVKPAFVILSAWFLSESHRREDVPSLHIAIAIYAVFVLLLVLQPDFGQAFLVTLVWGGLFFMAGMPLFWVGALGAGMVVAISVAYLTVPHVADRINSFFDTSDAGGYQMQRAMESFTSGGWFGKGPGEGTVKLLLPDSHADFVFAVIAEEYGLVACLVIAALFGFIVLRTLVRVLPETDCFLRYSVTGLMMLFGFQALINMSVNVGLLPAKGMTLPFLSYGGSSLLSMALAMGFALGLTRRRPKAARSRAQPEAAAESPGELKA